MTDVVDGAAVVDVVGVDVVGVDVVSIEVAGLDVVGAVELEVGVLDADVLDIDVLDADVGVVVVAACLGFVCDGGRLVGIADALVSVVATPDSSFCDVVPLVDVEFWL